MLPNEVTVVRGPQVAFGTCSSQPLLTVARGSQPLLYWTAIPLDTDGAPYFAVGAQVGIDTDGTPYRSPSLVIPNGTLQLDVDGVPYWEAR